MPYDFLNSSAISRSPGTDSDGADVTEVGELFQTRAAANGNYDHRMSEHLVDGTSS
jgi:hypothetical protein